MSNLATLFLIKGWNKNGNLYIIKIHLRLIYKHIYQ